MNRRAFQRLAEERLRDATVLLDQRRYSAAYYLAGYAVECALKACIAKQTMRHDFPPRRRYIEEIYTHEALRLVKALDLLAELELMKRADSVFDANWLFVLAWTEQSRYLIHTREAATALVQAVGDQDHGVLQWIRRYW